MNDLSNMALGKREPLPDKVALMMRDILTGVVPEVPVAADHLAAVPNWELGRNDQYGTCGPTSVANLVRLLNAYLGSSRQVTTEDVIDLYRRSGNPNFPTDDNGVYMHEMMDELLRNGIAGHKPLAFAKIAAGDTDTLMKAIAIFGGVLLGLDLKVAQQTQRTWDHVAGSEEWGGHAVLAALYRDPDGVSEDRIGIITWAHSLTTTRRFIDLQEDEAWVLIWPEHLSDRTFLEGVDVNALASAYQELTGDSFPLPDPPAPEPPAPAPAPAVPPALATALRRVMGTKSCPTYLRDAATQAGL